MFGMGMLGLTNTGVGHAPATMSSQANGARWLAETYDAKATVVGDNAKSLRKKAKKKKSPRKRDDALPSSELGRDDCVDYRTAADQNHYSNVVVNEAAANPITGESILNQHPVQTLEIEEDESIGNGGELISHPLAKSKTKIDRDDFDDEGVVVPRGDMSACSSAAARKAKANTREGRKKKKRRKKDKEGVAEDNAEVSSTAAGGAPETGRTVNGTCSSSTKANIRGDLLKTTMNKRKNKKKRKAESSGLEEEEGVDVEKTQEENSGGILFALPSSPAGAPTAQSCSSTANGHAKRAVGSPNTKKAVSGELSNGTSPHSAEAGGNPLFTNRGFGGASGAGSGDSHRRLPRKHQQQRKALPIFDHREEIIRAVKKHQTVVLVGETGSGKSTQVPQFLYEAGLTSAVEGCGWRRGEETSGTTPATRKATSGDSGTKPRRKAAGLLKRGVIGCTQPRRVAAVTVARRVAAEAGSELGHLVGYSVRFDDCTSTSTRIKYMTDGILLREVMSDPLLSAYSAIILDEAHERSLDTDILFGLIRRAQPERPDLKVIVMSATLDVDLFRRFFRDAISLQVPGRTHPVEVMYTKEDQDDYLDACLVTCLQIQENSEEDGDVLVFLPGQEDIEALAQLLSENLSTLRAERSRELAMEAADALESSDEREFHPPAEAIEARPLKGSGDGFLRPTMVCPVFAALPQEQQLDAFKPAPKGTRKFVLATNIAETSVTINGIRFVVDSGKVKTRSFQPSTGMELLRCQDVSKAQATQRAGRAGREASGVCYRLFREESYLSLEDAPIPEIMRVNLAQVVLQLKVIGIENPATFDYVTAPSPSALLAALKKLAMLGALDKEGGVTPDGKKMAALPLDPAFAHLVVRSAEPRFACAKEVLTTVACLSAESLLFYPSKEDAKRAASEAHRALAAYEGDLPTLLNIYRGFCKERKDPTWCRRNFVNGRALARAVDVRQQLAKISRERLRMDPEESCGAEMSRYLRCLVGGLFTNVATRQSAAAAVAATNGSGRSCYRTVIGNREVHIHPSSTLWRRNPPAKSVVFTELLSTTRDFIKTVTAVDASWLGELVPRFFKSSAGAPVTKGVAS